MASGPRVGRYRRGSAALVVGASRNDQRNDRQQRWNNPIPELLGLEHVSAPLSCSRVIRVVEPVEPVATRTLAARVR